MNRRITPRGVAATRNVCRSAGHLRRTTRQRRGAPFQTAELLRIKYPPAKKRCGSEHPTCLASRLLRRQHKTTFSKNLSCPCMHTLCFFSSARLGMNIYIQPMYVCRSAVRVIAFFPRDCAELTSFRFRRFYFSCWPSKGCVRVCGVVRWWLSRVSQGPMGCK